MQMIEKFIQENAVDEGFLQDWYINSVTDDQPVWTEEHIAEMCGDFYLIPKGAMKEEESRNGGWIPCSVETPKEGGIYLVTCRTGMRTCVTKVKWQPRVQEWNMSGLRSYWKVVAWQPLPEVYKGE